MMECPDNSTECLLRAILATQSTYNWDPLNFAFTAAIGILALVVAVLTVFQGLLTAGPGRIKGSRATIGPWAKYTKTRFSWTEMRLRTTTKTPFIHYVQLEVQKSDDSFEISLSHVQTYWQLLLQKLGRKVRDTVRDPSLVPAFPARWRSLLQSGGYTVSKERSLVDVDTDYLPSDVQAAPAWTTVKTAMKIAGLAGCTKISITPGSLYPEARGPNARLRFREHPDLGGIAIFDQFIRRRVYNSKGEEYGRMVLSENRDGAIAMYRATFRKSIGGLLSPGDFDFVEEDMNVRRESCSHPQCSAYGNSAHSARKRRVLVPLLARSPLSPRVLSLSSDRYLETMKHIGSQYEGTSVDISFGVVLQSINLVKVGKLDNPECIRSIDINLASRPFQAELVYRLAYSPYTGWYTLPDYDIGKETWPRLQKIQLGWSWLWPDRFLRSRFLAYPQDLSPFYGCTENNPNQPDDERLVILEDFDLILKNLRDGNLQAFDPWAHRYQMRTKLQLQLQEIDAWLHRYGGAISICQLRILVMDTITKMGKDQTKIDKSQIPTTQPPPDRHAESGRQATLNRNSFNVENSDIEGDEALKAKERSIRALLIFRAAIWTAYIHTAGDISFLNDAEKYGDIGNRVVQLL